MILALNGLGQVVGLLLKFNESEFKFFEPVSFSKTWPSVLAGEFGNYRSVALRGRN